MFMNIWINNPCKIYVMIHKFSILMGRHSTSQSIGFREFRPCNVLNLTMCFFKQIMFASDIQNGENMFNMQTLFPREILNIIFRFLNLLFVLDSKCHSYYIPTFNCHPINLTKNSVFRKILMDMLIWTYLVFQYLVMVFEVHTLMTQFYTLSFPRMWLRYTIINAQYVICSVTDNMLEYGQKIAQY